MELFARFADGDGAASVNVMAVKRATKVLAQRKVLSYIVIVSNTRMVVWNTCSRRCATSKFIPFHDDSSTASPLRRITPVDSFYATSSTSEDSDIGAFEIQGGPQA